MTNGDNETIVFVEIENLPEYKMCLLKKNNKTNDEEIFKVSNCDFIISSVAKDIFVIDIKTIANIRILLILFIFFSFINRI